MLETKGCGWHQVPPLISSVDFSEPLRMRIIIRPLGIVVKIKLD